jgi:hypothetical protein
MGSIKPCVLAYRFSTTKPKLRLIPHPSIIALGAISIAHHEAEGWAFLIWINVPTATVLLRL